MIDYGYGVFFKKLGRSSWTLGRTFEWRNSPYIYKWTRQFEPLDWPSHEAWINSLPSRKDVSMYEIYSVNDELIGVCGFTSIDLINRRAEFSLYIGPEYQGDKFGEKALKTLVKHGFNAYGFQVIWGETFDGNPAQKTFQKVGFIREGTRRNFYFRDGKFIDAHLYSIMPGELVD
jgi:RimJ/RimL family protein N-acetyltransferase